MKARSLAVAAAAAVAMEPVAALAHRFVMHRRGWSWHRSHHARPGGGLQPNDRYPTVFAGAALGAMAVGSARPRWRVLLAIGSGVTAYGAAYVLVHDVCLHGRLTGVPFVRGRYLRAIAVAHRAHHASNGPPYGFLAPVSRDAAGAPGGAPAAHADATVRSLTDVGTRARCEKTS
jgi:beta-carotene 3-hydroxylase